MDISPRLQTNRTGNTSGSTRSFFTRSLTRRDTDAQRSEDNSSQQPKGPLGLTTVHCPSGHVVSDLVFIHGLNGGSESTWTKGDETRFWPKHWLPQDQAFHDVRIHSFGYTAGLGRESILNIHDFAASLLSAIQDAPAMSNADHNVPLVLVGHSMGGLLLKKAYIMSCQNPDFELVAKRLRAVFFLATPHQGADIANTLSRVLALAPGSRPFVNDLLPQSPVLQAINAEFPRYSNDLQLFSFFETRAMNYVVGKGLIVEKQCAVMNYPNERRMYLDANHQDVARFSSVEDPNYVAIRNALASIVGAQRKTSNTTKQGVEIEQELAVGRFLGISEDGADDILMQDTRRLQGSGSWLLRRESFQQWREAFTSKLMWLRGRPGAGKSFLAGTVVNHLRELGYDSCSFFFSSGDSGRSSINAMLRSMAYQMARQHPEIRQALLGLSSRSGVATVDRIDHNSVWRQIFLTLILKIKLNRPQFWVLDAADECKNAAELMNLLTKAQESWPLCIFVTSRDSFESTINRANPGIEVLSDHVAEEDSNQDISLLLQTNLHLLKGPTQETREAVAREVLEKSKGCFLWANLMLNELLQVHTASETRKVLDSNPADMDQLYHNIVDGMSSYKYGKELSKAVLAWACCSLRPLSTEELRTALFVQLGEMIDNVEDSITSCCGSLVFVDSRKRLQLIHATAREFLLSEGLSSEFAVDKRDGNGLLAEICLEHLIDQTSSGKSASRSRSRSVTSVRPSAQQTGTRTAFAAYATEFVFQHVLQAKSNNEKLIALLVDFLQSPAVLVWIEHLAQEFDLRKVYQAGKTTLNILSRRSHHTPPIGAKASKQSFVLEKWGRDLLQIVPKFGRRIAKSPSSIHHIIPAFCPPSSIIRKQFTAHNRGLTVHGLQGADWDDCLTHISYAKGSRPLSAATGPGFFALGMSNGSIFIYDDVVFGEVLALKHAEPVWCLAFDEKGTFLASSGARSVRIWNLETGEELFRIPMRVFALALSFFSEEDLLVIAGKNNQLFYVDLVSGCLREDSLDWTKDLAEEGLEFHTRQPTRATISVNQRLLAIVYRGEDILLWDLAEDRVHDIIEKETGSRQNTSVKLGEGVTTVQTLEFSAAVDTSLLVASYVDGDLVLFDTYSGDMLHMLTSQHVTTLHSSPDGRTLAAADTRGNVSLFDFESLKYLYRISFENNYITSKFLAFTADGQRLVDVRSTQCRVWQPAVLMRQEIDDENSDTVSITTGPQEIDYQVAEEDPKITALFSVSSGSASVGGISGPVFLGKEDGSVHVQDISSNEPTSLPLFSQTTSCAIAEIYFDNGSGFIACRDLSGRVTCRKLIKLQRNSWSVEEPVLDINPEGTIHQILCSGIHSQVLICTSDGDSFWSFGASGGTSPARALSSGSQELPRRGWVPHPTDGRFVLCVQDFNVEVWHWADLTCTRKTVAESADLQNEIMEEVIPLHHSRYFATATNYQQRSSLARKRQQRYGGISIWDCDSVEADTLTPLCTLGALSFTVELIVGVAAERLIYLDLSHWICSVAISDTLEVPVRHFFIPDGWSSLVDEMIIDVGRMGEVLFVRKSELAVIKRGLETTESGAAFKAGRRRVSQASKVIPRRPAPTALPGRALQTN